MVVSVLVHRFAPSSRGLQKRQRGAQQQQQQYYDFADNYYYPPQDHYDSHLTAAAAATAATTQHQQQQRRRNASNTAHRRKPFKAMTCLTSLAADIDIVSDWCFYLHARATDQQCRREQNNAFLIPPLLINLVLTSCIVGTVLWVILATDGRIAAPILRRLGIDKLSMGLVLLLCVFFEDIPQIVLTFMIEDYYDQGGYLSEMALWNISASLYDSLLKLAEAYDERHDLVETGAWCKHSLSDAHGTNRVVTAVLALPAAAAAAVSSSHSTSSSSATRTPVGTTNHTNHAEPPPTMSQPPLPSMPLWFGPAPEASLLLPQPRVLPPLRFLSASVEEDVIKLWNCTNSSSSSSSTGSALMTSTTALNQPFTTAATITTTNRPVATALDVTPIVTVHCHGKFAAPKVTCLALLWLRTTVDETTTTTPAGISRSSTTTATDGSTDTAAICFLAGCSNGQVQLWNSDTGLCWCTFHDPIVAAAAVVSLAVLSDHAFVAGYQDGTARVWQISTGRCQGVYYHGSSTTVGAVCSLNDGVSFVTGSDDKMLRLWSVNSSSPSTTTITTTPPGTVHPLPSAKTSSHGSSSWWKALLRRSPSNVSTTTPDQWNHNSHNLDSNTVFATPYVQYTDSWLINHHERNCEKVFVGHTGAVLSVTCLGGETSLSSSSSSSRALVLVSGSRDGTARLWSVVDGTCWQVFRGHSASVTTVTAMDDVTLLTGSADATIKVWDVGSGKCLRTFEGHTAAVTGLSTTHDDSTTFVSSSVDGSVKIWVLTAVGQEDVEQPRAALWEDALDANDSWCCRGIDPD